MKTDAKFSNCLNYRFALWRTWDESKPFAMFIGLNPSKADEVEHNPTINRCINLAKSWGYGGACMANLFAYRATDPSEMKLQIDPVGAENDEWLVKLASGAGAVSYTDLWSFDEINAVKCAERLLPLPRGRLRGGRFSLLTPYKRQCALLPELV